LLVRLWFRAEALCQSIRCNSSVGTAQMHRRNTALLRHCYALTRHRKSSKDEDAASDICTLCAMDVPRAVEVLQIGNNRLRTKTAKFSESGLGTVQLMYSKIKRMNQHSNRLRTGELTASIIVTAPSLTLDHLRDCARQSCEQDPAVNSCDFSRRVAVVIQPRT
jgi:hypothetical protein